MADRTSAALFGMFFEFLAKNPSEENVEFARELWRETRNYDFVEYQMGAEDALIELGLARVTSYNDDGEEIEYANSNGEFND